MVSDVLHDALEDLKEYTEDAYWQSVYGPERLAAIAAVVASMEALRDRLDTAPIEPDHFCGADFCDDPICGEHGNEWAEWRLQR